MTESSTDAVLVDRRDGLMTITLNRPEARNAVNAAMAQSIAEALVELDDNQALRACVITGAGGTFCSGMDLKAYLKGERATIEGRGFAGMVQTPPVKPVIAAVEGYAVAGGCEIALACDLIVAAESSSFGLAEVKRGLIAAGGGLMRLPRRIPPAIAMEIALTGRPVSARRAYEVGLVNEVTADGAALERATDLALEICQNAPLAVAASKRIVSESREWSREEEWERQFEITVPVNRSEDAKEGALAFREKRLPQWRGR